MKTFKFRAIFLATTMAMIYSQAAFAGLVLTPIRCAGDNLPQWLHDTDPAHYGLNTPSNGTARGRQAWWKVCDPEEYATVNAGSAKFGIAAEYDPTANHNNGTFTRWYPTFGVINGIDPRTEMLDFSRPGNWVAPTVAPPTVGDPACQLPTNYTFVGMCASGCVTPDQEISTPDADIPIRDLEKINKPSVLVPMISHQSVIGYDPIKVERFIKDGTDALQKIVVISTQSGGHLRVSLEHPLLVKDYTMRKAENLKVGDSLVRADGQPDVIVAIQNEEYYGKVHNLTVDNSNLDKSLYIVGGFISGDKKFQDTRLSDINRKIFRTLVN